MVQSVLQEQGVTRLIMFLPALYKNTMTSKSKVPVKILNLHLFRKNTKQSVLTKKQYIRTASLRHSFSIPAIRSWSRLLTAFLMKIQIFCSREPCFLIRTSLKQSRTSSICSPMRYTTEPVQACERTSSLLAGTKTVLRGVGGV